MESVMACDGPLSRPVRLICQCIYLFGFGALCDSADGTSGCEDWNHLSSIVFESMIQFCADTLRNPSFDSHSLLLNPRFKMQGPETCSHIHAAFKWSQKHNYELCAHDKVKLYIYQWRTRRLEREQVSLQYMEGNEYHFLMYFSNAVNGKAWLM